MVERRAVYSEARCGAGWATYYPFRVAQNFQDVIALDIFECGAIVGVVCIPHRLFQLAQGYLER